MATGPALLVEVEVVAVAGVACVSGPDLEASAWIAGEDRGRAVMCGWAADEVGLVETAGGGFELRLCGGPCGVGGVDGCGVLDEVGVDEEVFEIAFAEGLLDADAVEGWGDGRAVGVGRRVAPEAGGAVAALGRPDAAWEFADVAAMGLDGGTDLGAKAFVGAEQRHVAVSCAAGDDLDQTEVVEVAEAGDDVAVEVVELVEGFGEEALPEARGFGEVIFAGAFEEGFVFAGGVDLALDVARELGEEDGVGELLEEDGREIEVAVEGDAIAFEVAEDAEEREIGFCGGFEEPLHAVGPGAVVDDVGKMGVQGEGKESGGLWRVIWPGIGLGFWVGHARSDSLQWVEAVPLVSSDAWKRLCAT